MTNIINNIDFAAVTAAILAIVAAMVAVTNIVVEVIKKLWGAGCPATLLAFIVAMLSALVALLVYCSVTGLAVLWYYIVGALLVGFCVAYAAMFGFDKLKQALNELNGGRNE